MEHIYSNSNQLNYLNLKTIISGLLLLIFIVYLYRKIKQEKNNLKDKSNISKSKIIKFDQQELKQSKNKINKQKKFEFNQNQIQSDDQQQQYDNDIMFTSSKTQKISTIWSTKKAKQNVLRNLQNLKYQQLIYYDKQDIQEREKRLKQKEQIQEKKSEILMKNKIKEAQKKQDKKGINQSKSKPLGEKFIFSDKKNVTNQIINKDKKFNENLSKIQIIPKQTEKQSSSAAINQNNLFNIVQKQKSTQTNIFNGIGNKTNIQQNKNIPAKIQIKKQQQKINIVPNIQSNSLYNNLPNSFINQPNPTVNRQDIFGGQIQQLKKQQPKKQQPKPLISQPKPIQIIPQTSKLPLPPLSFPLVLPASHPQQAASSKLPDELKKLSNVEYLQKIIQFATEPKQMSERRINLSNFYNTTSDLRQMYDAAMDFFRTIDQNNPKQVNTLALSLFDGIFNNIIPKFGTQLGWERFPPRNKSDSAWKRQLNTFIMKINLYRIMGHQKIWLIIFGKLLKLLDFTWKRTKQIKNYKDLDLIKNNYFQMKGDDMAIKYITRFDLITYFLFCMTTMDPELYSQYLCRTAGHDPQVLAQIRNHKHKWNYSYFWILVDSMLKNPLSSYFKPILYMNISNSIYLQTRKNKINDTEFKQFNNLAKYLLQKGNDQTSNTARQKNLELQNLLDIQQSTNLYTFSGQDFQGQIQTLKFYFKERLDQFKKPVSQFEKKCSILEYFKK